MSARTMTTRIILGVLIFGLSKAAHAEVLSADQNGFSVSHAVSSTAAPESVYKAMINNIDKWWNPDHSWSLKAENLYMRAEVGGCFCEHLPELGEGAGVEHLRIISLRPNTEIRFDGALGPLQAMPIQGRMVWKIDAQESGSSITFTYMVHGFLETGLEGFAPAVDGVIAEQAERLAAHLNQN